MSDIKKMSEVLVRSEIDRQGMSPGGMKSMVARLEKRLGELHTEAELAVCAYCGSEFVPLSAATCPFCGADEDGNPPALGETPAETPDETPDEAHDEDGNPPADEAEAGETPDETPGETPEEGPKKRGRPKGTGNKEPTKEKPAKEKQEKPAKEKQEKPAKEKQEKPAKEKPKAEGVPKKPKRPIAESLVVAEPVEIVEITPDGVKALDGSLARIGDIKLDIVGSTWDLGCELLELKTKKLWTQRPGDDGTPRYRTWADFVKAETDLSPSYSYELMTLAERATREQVIKIGVAKMAKIVALPEPERAPLLEKAATASLSDITREVRAIAETTGTVEPRNEASANAAKAGQASAEKRVSAPREITIASIIGKARIPLFAGKTDQRAQTIAQDPTGAELLANGVEVKYLIVKTQKGIELVIERRRTKN